MIKSPYTIYFDIETYSQYLKETNQKVTNHEKLLKPYLVSYILKCNYDEKFSKNVKYLQDLIVFQKCYIIY